MSDGTGYPFGQLVLAVPAVSPPDPLLTPRLQAFKMGDLERQP